jgi:hypothetical protein
MCDACAERHSSDVPSGGAQSNTHFAVHYPPGLDVRRAVWYVGLNSLPPPMALPPSFSCLLTQLLFLRSHPFIARLPLRFDYVRTGMCPSACFLPFLMTSVVLTAVVGLELAGPMRC